MVGGDSGSSEEEAPEDGSEWKGILATRGMDLRLEGLQLALSEEGLTSSIGRVSIRSDQCSHWLEIAVDHLDAARAAYGTLLEEYESEDNGDLVEAIELEFRASMQAIVACAIGLDALYAAVKERIEISAELVAKWKKNNTPRWAQIAQVLQRGFNIGGREEMEGVQDVVQTMFKFRDWAVHPPAGFREVKPRWDIKRDVEWRFVAFRYSNARTGVNRTLSLVSQLATKDRMKTDALKKYCKFLHETVESLIEDWDRQYPDLEL